MFFTTKPFLLPDILSGGDKKNVIHQRHHYFLLITRLLKKKMYRTYNKYAQGLISIIIKSLLKYICFRNMKIIVTTGTAVVDI